MDENIVSVIGIIIIFLIFITVNNLAYVIKSENFKSNSTPEQNKTIIDTYLDYNKKVYEYIYKKNIPNRKKDYDAQPVTMDEYYNKVNTRFREFFTLDKCGYLYNYHNNEISEPGTMYLIESGIAINIKDKNNKDGIFDVINDNITLVISDGNITYQLIKNEVKVDRLTNIISVIGDLKTFKDDLKENINYILYPCSTLEHIENTPPPTNPLGGDGSIQQTIVDSNVSNTFFIYLSLMTLVMLVYNWKFFYNLILNLFSKNKNKETESSDTEIKNIYYVGGYDYKDYSE